MTIEARINYLGIYTDRPRRIEPDREGIILLDETWVEPQDGGIGRYEAITVVDDETIILRLGQTEMKKDIDVIDSGRITLDKNQINAWGLESARDHMGRKTTFTYKDSE